MVARFTIMLLLLAFVLSCQNEGKTREAEMIKDLKKKELIFNKINDSWSFKTVTLQPKSLSLVSNWAEWRLLNTGLQQKPKSTIGAFQKKATELTRKADAVLQSLPFDINKPEIKTRFAVLLNSFRSLEMYITLDDIPDQKVITTIGEINLQLTSIEVQLDELIKKSDIPVETGETDMIKMLDTSRAVKKVPKNIN